MISKAKFALAVLVAATMIGCGNDSGGAVEGDNAAGKAAADAPQGQSVRGNAPTRGNAPPGRQGMPGTL